MSNKEKKLVLVTGGTRGIGKAISLAFHMQNYEVIANYSGNAEAASELTKQYGIETYKWDVSNFEECKKNIEIIEKIHQRSIDILVSNAGVTNDKFLHKLDDEQYLKWLQVVEINLISGMNLCFHTINKMRNNQFGRIIFIGSINGQKGQIGQTNYSASKAGLIGFAKALARENANKNITVNVVSPGYIETEMTKKIDQDILEKIIKDIPVGRMGTPEEVARAVLFLSSDHSGFITGETLSINGGQYML